MGIWSASGGLRLDFDRRNPPAGLGIRSGCASSRFGTASCPLANFGRPGSGHSHGPGESVDPCRRAQPLGSAEERVRRLRTACTLGGCAGRRACLQRLQQGGRIPIDGRLGINPDSRGPGGPYPPDRHRRRPISLAPARCSAAGWRRLDPHPNGRMPGGGRYTRLALSPISSERVALACPFSQTFRQRPATGQGSGGRCRSPRLLPSGHGSCAEGAAYGRTFNALLMLSPASERTAIVDSPPPRPGIKKPTKRS